MTIMVRMFFTQLLDTPLPTVSEIAPRKQRNEKVDLLVDLVAILEDHEEAE